MEPLPKSTIFYSFLLISQKLHETKKNYLLSPCPRPVFECGRNLWNVYIFAILYPNELKFKLQAYFDLRNSFLSSLKPHMMRYWLRSVTILHLISHPHIYVYLQLSGQVSGNTWHMVNLLRQRKLIPNIRPLKFFPSHILLFENLVK